MQTIKIKVVTSNPVKSFIKVGTTLAVGFYGGRLYQRVTDIMLLRRLRNERNK